jgi:hypothetical protein
MALEDITGRALPAIDVFSLSIRALKEHLIETLVKQGTTEQEPTRLRKLILCYIPF